MPDTGLHGPLSPQPQPRLADGTFGSLEPATVNAIKTRVLEEIASGATLLRAVEAAGASWATVWRMRQADPDFAAAIDAWRFGVGVRSVAVMEDAVQHPDQYESGLRYASWANFAMITAKAAFPDMRDSAQINVNVDARTAVGDWQAAIRAAQAEDPNA